MSIMVCAAYLPIAPRRLSFLDIGNAFANLYDGLCHAFMYIRVYMMNIDTNSRIEHALCIEKLSVQKKMERNKNSSASMEISHL